MAALDGVAVMSQADQPETGAKTSPAMAALVAELNRVTIDLRADRAPKPEMKPEAKSLSWWRWLRTTG
jgi:hypothetical protein